MDPSIKIGTSSNNAVERVPGCENSRSEEVVEGRIAFAPWDFVFVDASNLVAPNLSFIGNSGTDFDVCRGSIEAMEAVVFAPNFFHTSRGCCLDKRAAGDERCDGDGRRTFHLSTYSRGIAIRDRGRALDDVAPHWNRVDEKSSPCGHWLSRCLGSIWDSARVSFGNSLVRDGVGIPVVS